MLRWVVLSLLWRRGRGTCRRFVVLSSQRSGTELLASMLRAGGAGMRTVEPLWHCRTKKLKKSSFAAEAAAAAWGGAASPAVARSGCEGLTLASDDNDACGRENLTGFTLMYSQLARGGAALEAAVLARPRPAVVHLVRNDSLARHVSVLANAHAKHGGAERARADAHRAPPSPVAVRVPMSGVLSALEARERDVRSARRALRRLRLASLELSYEALAAAPGAAAAAAWRQLVGGAYAARPGAEPTPARPHAGAVREHVADWPDVVGALRGTRFEWMLRCGAGCDCAPPRTARDDAAPAAPPAAAGAREPAAATRGVLLFAVGAPLGETDGAPAIGEALRLARTIRRFHASARDLGVCLDYHVVAADDPARGAAEAELRRRAAPLGVELRAVAFDAAPSLARAALARGCKLQDGCDERALA